MVAGKYKESAKRGRAAHAVGGGTEKALAKNVPKKRGIVKKRKQREERGLKEKMAHLGGFVPYGAPPAKQKDNRERQG